MSIPSLEFGLGEMAGHVRRWLQWTAREGAVGPDTDVQFPVRPSYRQFEVWAETMEKSAEALRHREEMLAALKDLVKITGAVEATPAGTPSADKINARLSAAEKQARAAIAKAENQS